MKRWSLFVLILFLVVFFDITLLFARGNNPKLLVVEPFKISDYTQLIVLPLDTSSIVYKKDGSVLKPSEEALLKANEFLVKGLKRNAPRKLNIILNGKQDTPQTLIIKCGIPKIRFEIESNQIGHDIWFELKGDVVDAQSQKVLLQFNAKRNSSVPPNLAKEYYDDKLLSNYKEIGEDFGELLTENFFKYSNKVYPPKHEPGKYTNWKRTCNEVEIIKPFNFKNYSYIIVKPLDTTSTIIPEKTNENDLHEPSLNYLSKIDKIFIEMIQEHMEDEDSLFDVVFIKEDNQVKDLRGKALILKGRINKLDPGDPMARLKNFVTYLFIPVNRSTGEAKIEIEGEVIDAQTNEILLKFKDYKFSKKSTDKNPKSFKDTILGSFEGALGGALDWTVEDICDVLKKFD